MQVCRAPKRAGLLGMKSRDLSRPCCHPLYDLKYRPHCAEMTMGTFGCGNIYGNPASRLFDGFWRGVRGSPQGSSDIVGYHCGTAEIGRNITKFCPTLSHSPLLLDKRALTEIYLNLPSHLLSHIVAVVFGAPRFCFTLA